MFSCTDPQSSQLAGPCVFAKYGRWVNQWVNQWVNPRAKNAQGMCKPSLLVSNRTKAWIHSLNSLPNAPARKTHRSFWVSQHRELFKAGLKIWVSCEGTRFWAGFARRLVPGQKCRTPGSPRVLPPPCSPTWQSWRGAVVLPNKFDLFAIESSSRKVSSPSLFVCHYSGVPPKYTNIYNLKSPQSEM